MGCSGNIEEYDKKRQLPLRGSKISKNSNTDFSFEKQIINNNDNLQQNLKIKINKNRNDIEDSILLNKKKKYINIMHEKHLHFRNLHGCSNNLYLEDSLNELAQEYAKKLINSPNHIYYNNYTYKGEALGENIDISEGKINPEEICNKWYKESEIYKYTNKFQKETVHFTQIVWNNTKKVGFGFEMKDNIYSVVALYYPAGNIFNEFDKNVGIKKIDKKNSK